MSGKSHRWPQVVARVMAGVFGSYALTWSSVAASIAALVAIGVDFHEAETGVNLIAFFLFLGLFLWSFAAASIIRVWMFLVGGAVLLFALAWALQRSILA